MKQGDAADAGLLESLQQLGERLRFLDCDDVGARHHDVLDAARAEPQEPQQDLALFCGEIVVAALAL